MPVDATIALAVAWGAPVSILYRDDGLTEPI
jgi:hypothetical protein